MGRARSKNGLHGFGVVSFFQFFITGSSMPGWQERQRPTRTIFSSSLWLKGLSPFLLVCTIGAPSVPTKASRRLSCPNMVAFTELEGVKPKLPSFLRNMFPYPSPMLFGFSWQSRQVLVFLVVVCGSMVETVSLSKVPLNSSLSSRKLTKSCQPGTRTTTLLPPPPSISFSGFSSRTPSTGLS